MSFEKIYYQGKEVKRDHSTQVRYLTLARNKIHRWWLIHVRHFNPDIVFYRKDFDGKWNFGVDVGQPKSTWKDWIEGRWIK